MYISIFIYDQQSNLRICSNYLGHCFLCDMMFRVPAFCCIRACGLQNQEQKYKMWWIPLFQLICSRNDRQLFTLSIIRRSLTMVLETIALTSAANSVGHILAMCPRATMDVMKLADSGVRDFLTYWRNKSL